MAIDPLGRNGAPPPSPGVDGAGAARPSEAPRPYEVDPQPPKVVPVLAPTDLAPSALEQLRAGQIDVNGYVDQKIDEATRHLQGLGAPELTALKEILRAQLVSDPALADLVTQVAGALPRED